MTSARRDWVRRGWLPLAIVVVTALAFVGVRAVLAPESNWGTRAERIASPTGEFEVVQYEWSAMIDPGWNLAIERVETGEREWFWRSTEMPAPKSIRFTGPTSIEVTDDMAQVYRVEFDPASLEPSDRYCLSVSYCTHAPWDGYTRNAP